MAIAINGDGTITGISVGGLPDGVVDAGTLAANSVDSAELIDGAVDDSHMAAMAASKLTGALPAISGASLTNLDARDLENALPAISGASLTGVTGSSKNGSFYLNLTTATGTVSVTSMGFTPKHLIVHFAIDNRRLIGFGMMGTMTRFSIASEDYNNVWWPNNSAQMRTAGGTMQQLDLSSLDSNGFTLSHTKTGSPTGSVRISWIAFG